MLVITKLILTDEQKIEKERCVGKNSASSKLNCITMMYLIKDPTVFGVHILLITRQFIYQNRKEMAILKYMVVFCSPECAVAYLKKEPLDTSTLWERYALLNNVYSDIYNYENNIKPAPDPHYILDKYYGTLTIQEYRKLLNNQQLLLVVEKPLTKILPELYEENNDSPTIYSNLLTEKSLGKQQLRLHRKLPKNSKKSILNSNFNM